MYVFRNSLTDLFVMHSVFFLSSSEEKQTTQKERYSAKSNKIGRPLVTHPSSLGDRSEIYYPIGCGQPSLPALCHCTTVDGLTEERDGFGFDRVVFSPQSPIHQQRTTTDWI